MSILIPGKPGQIIGSVIGFFAGPWGKIAMYGLLAVGLLYGFRLWLNRHDDRVYAQAQEKTIQKFEVQYVSQWQKALTEAKVLADNANAKLEAADALNRRVDMKFATIFTSLTQIRQAVEDRKVIYVKEAAAVSDADLDDALRTLSGVIAAQAPHR